MKLAHALTDEAGKFLDMDEAYCQLMERSREELLKLDLLTLTHPHDRTDNHGKLEALRRDGTSFVITKRYLRPSAAPIWVENYVSLFRDGGAPRPVATIRLLGEDEATLTQRTLASPKAVVADSELPAELAARARKMQRLRIRARGYLPENIVGTPAYDMLLELAASEAEGRAVDVTTLCLAADVSNTTGLRWTNLLEEQRLIETVRCQTDRRRRLVRLKAVARLGIGRHLSDIPDC